MNTFLSLFGHVCGEGDALEKALGCLVGSSVVFIEGTRCFETLVIKIKDEEGSFATVDVLSPTFHHLDAYVICLAQERPFSTHGDATMETDSEFLVVSEHRLVPARATVTHRSSGEGAAAVWAPATR